MKSNVHVAALSVIIVFQYLSEYYTCPIAINVPVDMHGTISVSDQSVYFVVSNSR